MRPRLRRLGWLPLALFVGGLRHLSFNEAEAATPRMVRCAGRPSRCSSCFNEAEAATPRMACFLSTVLLLPLRFNEAEAATPRMGLPSNHLDDRSNSPPFREPPR